MAVAADDMRWKQRLDNFERALAVLERTVARCTDRDPDEVEQLALIQCFEFTHELAWNVLKDYLEFEGLATSGSRSATRAAIQRGLIDAVDVWMDMVDSRNLTTHTYSERTAAAVAHDVAARFLPEFRNLRATMAAQAESKP